MHSDSDQTQLAIYENTLPNTMEQNDVRLIPVLASYRQMSLMYMDSNESRWSVMNSASLGQFGTWVFPYIPHHVIVKEEGL